MHSIHWAAIFSSAGVYVLFIFIALMLLRDFRNKRGPRRIGDGEHVRVTLATGETRTGYVAGAAPTAIDGGFTIVCTRDPA